MAIRTIWRIRGCCERCRSGPNNEAGVELRASCCRGVCSRAEGDSADVSLEGVLADGSEGQWEKRQCKMLTRLLDAEVSDHKLHRKGRWIRWLRPARFRDLLCYTGASRSTAITFVPMTNSDQSSQPQIDQSQQSGGLSLGAYNRFEQIQIGDVIGGDKIAVQTFQLIVYTGPIQPVDPSARRDLEQAYRSEVALRYAVWKTRYAALPMQLRVQPAPSAVGLSFFEAEDFLFQALGKRLQQPDRVEQPAEPEAAPAPIIEMFSDLREGLHRYQNLLLLAPPGGGKTTALWRLALDLARDGLAQPALPLPVFVRLGGLRKGETLNVLLHRELAMATLYDGRKRPVLLPAHRQMAAQLPNLLTNGRAVILWDGLNETPSELFFSTATAIAQFC